MKKIGTTSTGSIIVEMSAEEFASLDLTVTPKKKENAAHPNAKTMSVLEIAEYAAPKLTKLEPKRKEGVVHSIASMFHTTGGIDEEKIEKVFSQLVSMRIFANDGGRIKFKTA